MANNPETLKRYANSHKEQIKASRKRYRDTHKEQAREYRIKQKEENPEKVRESARKSYIKNKNQKREYQRTLRKKYKDTFLEMYGGGCSCCGETTYEFLTIEHKNGQEKAARRTGMVAYRDAKRENRIPFLWSCEV